MVHSEFNMALVRVIDAFLELLFRQTELQENGNHDMCECFNTIAEKIQEVVDVLNSTPKIKLKKFSNLLEVIALCCETLNTNLSNINYSIISLGNKLDNINSTLNNIKDAIEEGGHPGGGHHH